MKLEMLRVFQVTAEQGSLSRAADILGRTPSAVSMMLAQFEEHVGGALFETDRKNRLTALGVLVLEESSRATEAFERSTNAIRRHAMSRAGSVRIAAVPSATVTLLPSVVAAFRQARPDVRLEISDVDSAAVRRRVRFDEADIGILSASPTDDSGGTVILRDALGIVCRADGPIARRLAGSDHQTQWELLTHEPLITNPLCQLVDNERVQALIVRSTLEARNTTALLAFVHAGLGATILPESSLQAKPDGLRFIQPTDPAAFRDIRKIQPEGRRLSPVAKAFWDALPILQDD
ncbi:LysR family transcriptional regulator [Phaeovulum sp.]|uniref:LysR family transcriptional regulator n=1 Tax=Phaeovulum sp. TaxID=2934796 RepID=UPI0039E55DBC